MAEISSATAVADLRLFLSKKTGGKILTQRGLGALIGISQCAVSHYECGRRRPDSRTSRQFIALARRYKYPKTEALIESLV